MKMEVMMKFKMAATSFIIINHFCIGLYNPHHGDQIALLKYIQHIFTQKSNSVQLNSHGGK